jgi:Tfp pilus assembly protein PilN
MRAVNLLPSDARRRGGSFRDISGGTAALFGALVLALVLVGSWVVLSNGVSSRQDKLADLNRQQASFERQVAELKPYADLEALRQSLLQQVRTLADGRYDWSKALDRLARAFPADTALDSFEGTGGATAPAVSLSGCTPSHDDVALLIDRLRAVRGVTGVALQSSTVAPGDRGCAEKFALTVQLKGATTAAPAAGATPGATPTPAPTPTPGAPTASADTGNGGTS